MKLMRSLLLLSTSAALCTAAAVAQDAPDWRTPLRYETRSSESSCAAPAASFVTQWAADACRAQRVVRVEREDDDLLDSPGMGDMAALRLGYHGSATDFTVQPAWYAQAAMQEQQIAAAVPEGVPIYRPDAASPLALSTSTFTLLGPMPNTGEQLGAQRAAGRVNVVVSDPDNTAVAWLGADGGGVWKTTNCCTSSTTWTVKTDIAQISTMAIDDIAMDPSNHNVLYAATGDLNYGSFSFGSAGVLKSTDRGETWTVLGESVFNMMYAPSANAYPQYQSLSKIAVDPNNSNRVVAGTKTGLYFSYDGGSNWTGPCYTNGFATGANAQRQDMTGVLAVNNSGTTKLYAAVGTRGKATPVQPDLGNNGANGVYSAAMPSSGCPAVSAWTLLSSGMPSGLGNGQPNANLGRVEIAVAPSNSQVLYTMISDIPSSGVYGIYKTTNGGSSWTQLNNPNGGTSPGGGQGTNAGQQMWYDAGITVSPTDPNTYFLSTVDLLMSRDGSSYTNLSNSYGGGPVHPDNHARAIVGGNHDHVINGNDGGVYYISNAVSGASSPNWVDMNSALPTLEVYGGQTSANFATAANPVAVAGFQDNGSSTVQFSGTPTGPVAWQSNYGGDGFWSLVEPVKTAGFYTSYTYGDIHYATSRTATGTSIGGGWTPGQASGDRKSFVTQYDMYRFGSTGTSGSGCTTTSGCTHLIYGSYRVWESTAATPSSSTWSAKTGDVTKNNLVIGSDNRSYVQQIHYSFTDPSVAILGTSDGNVQYVFGLGGSGAASAVNVTGNNATLPNRTIQDVSTDPTNPLIGYAAVAGFTANTPSTPGHVFQVTCTANCASFNWVDKSGNLPDIPADSIMPNPLNAKQVFVGTDWGLYFTNDITAATPSWQRFEGLPHVMVWSLSVDRGFTTLSAYTRARGVWAWPLPSGSVGAPFSVSATPASASVCAGTPASFTVNLTSNNYSGTVSLAASGNPSGSSASFNPTSVSTFPGSSTMSVSTTGVATGNYPITITGTGTGSPAPAPQTASVTLNVSGGSAVAPTLTTPANGATGIATASTFSWNASAGATSYTLDIATDAQFNNIVQSIPNLTGTSTSVTGLAANTTYYWSVQAINGCGHTTSAVSSFTTAAVVAPMCSSPGKTIPATDSITITDPSQLSALQVQIQSTYSWTGDLKFTLSNGSSSDVLINQPGVAQGLNAGFGCGTANVNVTLDDTGTTQVDNQCNSSAPAQSGIDKPSSPIGAAFANKPFAGTWTLSVTQPGSFALGSGSLTKWCLVPTLAAAPTYKVGGNVTNLSGTGLVLSLNSGAQTLPVSASGAFQFPTGLNTGASYAVTVGTQPSGQTCTVSNGSGTIASANVTNVGVSCTNNVVNYTVTPSVSGGNGAISPNTAQTVASGMTTNFTLTPNAGYHAVTPTGTCPAGSLSGNTYTTGAITANCTVIASFAINTYTVTATPGSNGAITPPSQTVAAGGTATFTVNANPHYHVASVTGDTCTVTHGNGNSWSSNAINANCAVTATFALNKLVFTTQPSNVMQGAALGTVVVSEQDGNGNTMGDSATLDFTLTTACGALDLGTATMTNGVATLSSSQRFYATASGLTIASADSGNTLATTTSSGFAVTQNADMVFASGLEACRP